MSSSNRKRTNEPQIVVPKPSDDNPRYARVGIIAAIGFAVGVAWPGLARLELVPRPPAEAPQKPIGSAEAPILAASVPPPPQLPGPPKPVVTEPRVKLAEIVSCVDADGRRHKKCGELSLDKSLVEPLRSLVACDGAQGQKGILSLGFDIDFDDGKISSLTAGRSTTLPTEVTQSLVTCATEVLGKVELSGLDHTFNRYRVFYLIELRGSESGGTKDTVAAGAVAATSDADAPGTATGTETGATTVTTGAEVQGASGRATVAWEVALIRKVPKDGAVVARVLGGTRVVVTGRQGDWYRIKYNAQGDEGFVFKSAIGM